MNASRRARSGLTLIELMLVLSILGIVAATAFRPAARAIIHARANRAAAVVATDLESVVTLASRARTPLRLTVDAANKRVTVTKRSTGTVLLTRVLGSGSEFDLSGVAGSPASVDIFPSGIASSGITVTLTLSGYIRQVVMTRVGRVRVAPL